MCVCVCICKYVYMYIYIYTYTYTHIYKTKKKTIQKPKSLALMLLRNINKPFTYVLDAFIVSIFIQVSDFCDNSPQCHLPTESRHQMFTFFYKNHIQAIYVSTFTKGFLIIIKYQYQ